MREGRIPETGPREGESRPFPAILRIALAKTMDWKKKKKQDGERSETGAILTDVDGYLNAFQTN